MITTHKMIAGTTKETIDYYSAVLGTKEEILEHYSFVDGIKFRWITNLTVGEQLSKIIELDKSTGFMVYVENTSGEYWKVQQDVVLIRNIGENKPPLRFSEDEDHEKLIEFLNSPERPEIIKFSSQITCKSHPNILSKDITKEQIDEWNDNQDKQVNFYIYTA